MYVLLFFWTHCILSLTLNWLLPLAGVRMLNLWCLLCARHLAKNLTSISLLNSHNSSNTRYWIIIVLLYTLYKWEDGSSERLSNLLMIVQLRLNQASPEHGLLSLHALCSSPPWPILIGTLYKRDRGLFSTQLFDAWLHQSLTNHAANFVHTNYFTSPPDSVISHLHQRFHTQLILLSRQ